MSCCWPTSIVAALSIAAASISTAHAELAQRYAPAQRQAAGALDTKLDLSGRTQRGIASYYAKRFAGRTMADGTRMDPHGDNAASKTLPLGTTARVTNLENGKSAIVTIKDRGPYIKGRIVDLSPATARDVGITPDKGLARVAVAPIAIPLPDGSVKWNDTMAMAANR